MSNWDLMMPGMGLTAIGLAGVTISYAGIAHTFIDGMHALTGLTMMIGLIFLSAGILEGGVSTSNRAKATTLVILGISLSFGVAALTFNSISTIPTLAGVMLIVVIPAIVMAYTSMKMPQYAKPIGIIFVIATGAAISAYVGFGLYGPSQYLVTPPEPEEEEKAPILTAPVTTISILKGSSVQGSPDYDPDVAQVPAGNNVEWVNNDDIVHTATATDGKSFDTGVIEAGKSYTLDTSKLQPGTYDYMCIVHPYMISTLVYGGEAPVVPEVPISILKDSSVSGNPDYEPDTAQITKGDAIVWTNNDSTMHTATAADGTAFDSGILNSGDTFKLDTSKLNLGTYDYICSLHPYMRSSFEIVDSSGQRLAEGATAIDPNSIPPTEEPIVEAPVEVPVEESVETPEIPIEEIPEELVEEIPVETPTEESVGTSEENMIPVETTVDMAIGTGSNTECGDQCFVPNVIKVAPGGKITWTNSDTIFHTATAVDGSFDTGLVKAGETGTLTFDNPGTYDYMCSLHIWMKGQVVVE